MTRKIIKFIIFSLFIILSTTAFAQFENCSNGIDDDGDGKIDCFDSNCSNSPFCQSYETQCDDGVDNDGDGLPDCIDPDCYYSGICPTEVDCNNGIDDDGDGFFDYYDGDCLNDPDNPNTYITNIADCEVKPQGNVFEIEPEWQSEARTSGVYAVPIVADLDGDGISEIISANDQTRTITILNGKDGTTIRKAVLPSSLFAYPAVADVDDDGFGEIFIFDNSGRLYAYNHDLTPFWGSSKQAPLSRGLIASIADFNQDGDPEVYYTNEIRDANTGQLIVKGSHNQGTKEQQWDVHLARMSVAVNILPDSYCPDCSGLELVLGNIIYAVDIDNKQLTPVLNMDDAVTKTLVNPIGGFTYQNTDKYRGKSAQFSGQNFSTTSVVDFNEDGNMDVVLSGTLNNETTGPTMIFFWDITNNTVKARVITRPHNKIPGALMGNFKDVNGGGCDAADGECTWKRGMGTLNVANIDNDPELEVTFMSGSSLYALDQNLNEEWANHDDFWETSSGFTGTTVFDFDGDGASEVVYRDEIDLYIIDGTTGIPLNSKIAGTFCSSQTQAEFPVVADVDADGETEIIVSCGCLENTRTSLQTSNTRDCGYVRTYKAANNNYWVPARKLWNQYVYFNVNINDDLSIPHFQQYHHLSFAQKCALLGPDIPKFSLNKFYNQSPIISYCGNLAFPAPNLEFADNPIQVEPPTCPDARFQVRLRFVNTGDQAAFKDIPVSFYADDPEQNYLNTEANPYLETIYLNIPGGLQVNQLIDTTLWVNGKPGAFTLYTSLNDIGPFDLNGSSISNENFYPLDSLNGTIRECDGTPTVVNIDVNPYPFNTTAVLIKDNDNCPGAYNSNGAITAHVAGDTVGYVFRWFEGSTTSGSPDFIGATQKGLTGGKYTVVATHIIAKCTGNSSTVTVKDLSAPPVIGAEVLSLQRSCDSNNPSGSLTAYVLQGSNRVTAGYNFFWYKGQNTVNPAHPGYTGGPTVDQLSAGIYRVVVEQISTGCTASMDIEVKEVLTDPVISLVSKNDQTICDPANFDGQASVSVNGNTANYDFYWYSGNVSSPDTTSVNVIAKSSIITRLDKGTYTAFAVDKITRCISKPLKVKILDKTWNPVVNTQVLNPQQACDLSLANGSMQASVDETSKGGSNGVITGYTFEWYLGTFTSSTLPATPTANGSTVNGLVEGKYTLVTRSTTSGCQTISYATLPSQKTRPVLDPATVTHTDNCTDPWGSEIKVTADGGRTSADGYTFQWRHISTNTILAETSNVLSNIPPGEYGIRVTNPLGCTSLNEMKVTIKDEGPKPIVSLLTVPNSSCDAAQSNGMLIARDFAGVASDYTFSWTNNSGTQVGTSDTVRFLPQGKYTLRITDNASQCFQIAYANIGTQPAVQPTLDTLYTNATTDCRPTFANGEAQFHLPAGLAQIPPDFTVDRTYTFELYSGTTVSGAPVQSNADGLFTGLNNEEYTAIVRDNYNHCVSAPMTIEIPKDPGITINLDYSTPSSACASSDGALQISVSSPNNNTASSPIYGYTFEWYMRNPGDPQPGSPNPGTIVNETGFVSERTDLPSGYYTIEVYDNFSNCVETFQYFLPNADPPQITDNVITDATQCGPGNGSIYIEVTSPSILLNLFQVFLYEGNVIDPGNEVSVWIPLALPSDDHTFSNLMAGQYTIAFKEIFGGSCYSTVQNYTVPDNIPDTEITVDISPDFTCNTIGTGSLSVSDVKQNGSSESLSDFSYEWREGVGTSGTLVGTGLNATNLISGNYTVVVTDNASGDGQGCTYTKTVFLNNQPKVLAINAYTTKPNELCTGNDGEIMITDLTEDGTSVDINNYTLTLQDDAGNAAFTSGGNGQIGNPFSGLAEGTYFVNAENIATGCSILSSAIIIDKETYEPVISLIDDFPDFSCTGGQFTGMLQVGANSPADGNTTDFDFIWYRGNVVDLANQLTSANIDPSNSARAIGLEAGEYIVEVIDNAGQSNGCSQTAIFEVLPVDREINFGLAGLDPTYCDPANGEISEQTIEESYFYNGSMVTTTTNVLDYQYTLLDADLNVIVSGDTDGKFDALDEGTYYVQAQNINSDNCLSDPVGIILVSLCVPPVVTVNLDNPQYSNNPDPSTWTGSISIDVMESPDNPVDSLSNNFTYTFEVYKTDSNGNPIGSNLNPTNSTSINMLDSGNYVIVVKNNVTGATSTSSFYLPKVKIEPEFVATGNPQTVCYPDGSATLAEITFRDLLDDPAKYTIYLYENSSLTTLADSVVVANNGDILFEDLGQGSYYLQAKHNAYLLLSDIFEVEVSNTSQVPLIDLDVNNLYPQISCQPQILATGKLAVIASERNGASDNYQYQWYHGNNTMAENIISGATNASLDSLPSGFYTVEVYNTRTRCTATKTLYVEDRIEIPLVRVESEPSTVCDPALANGTVSAKVVQSGNYLFEWYEGNTTTGLPAHTGETWGGLMPGTYTVVSTDMITGTCSSLPVSVQVEDASETPLVMIEKVADNSACDPALSNGVLSANMPYPVAEYEYTWFDASGTVIGNASTIGSLSEGTYSLEVIYKPSGCINTTQAEIILTPVEYSPPTVSINSHMTNCVFPDGSATALMFEENEAFIFTWYDVSGNILPEENVVINENDFSSSAINLSAGTYYVEAFDLTTGCYAPQARVIIDDLSYVAEHKIEASPASCEVINGSMKVIPQESMTIQSVSWTHLYTSQTFETNYLLDDAPAGEYEYLITWENGCTSTGSAILPADINVFNGVSPNGDGDNDIFHIDCIDQFPNNTIKIFNRAGALVYEAKGYDNNSIFFDGLGNRGLYIGNKQLPDGTYFYVIEKNNGDKAVNGYLELFR